MCQFFLYFLLNVLKSLFIAKYSFFTKYCLSELDRLSKSIKILI